MATPDQFQPQPTPGVSFGNAQSEGVEAPETPGIQAYAPTPSLASLQPVAGIRAYAEPKDNPPLMDEAILSNRVQKYHFGLGDDSPGPEQLSSEIIRGQEDTARVSRSAAENLKDLQTRQQFVQQLAANRAPGAPLTEQEEKALSALSPQDYEEIRNDPKTFYEKKFAQRVTSSAIDTKLKDLWSQPSVLDNGLAEPTNVPGMELFHKVTNATEDIITRQQAFMKIMEDRGTKWSGLGLASKVLSVAGTFIPFRNTQIYADVLGPETGQILPGNSIADAINYLWHVPIRDSVNEANRIIDALEERSPALALSFSQSLLSYSTTSQFLDNSQLFADLATGAAATGKVAMFAGKFRPTIFATAMKDVIKASALRKFNPGDIAEATGNFNVAGQFKGLEIIKNLSDRVSPGSFDKLRAALPEAWDPKASLGGEPSKLSDEIARRYAALVTANRKVIQDTVGKILDNPFSINRLEPGSEAEKVATQATDRIFNIQYPNVHDRILGVKTVRQEETTGGLYRNYAIGDLARQPGATAEGEVIPVKGGFETQPRTTVPFKGVAANDEMSVLFGHKDATLFNSPEAAEWSAKNELGLHGYKVNQHGAGWYIEYTKAVDERTTDVMNALKIDTEFATPRSFGNYVLGHVFSYAKRMSREAERDILTATYGTSGMVKAIEAAAKPIRDLKGDKNAWKAVQEFMTMQQSKLDETGRPGVYSKSIHDFARDFLDYHKRLPTEKEVAGYFATTDLSDGDYVIRSIKAHTEKVRNGAELHGFTYLGPDGKALKATPSIEGKVLLNADEVFAKKQDAGILVLHKDVDKLAGPFQKNGDAGYFRKNFPSGSWGKGGVKARQDYVNNLLKNEGYRIVHLSPYGREELGKLPQYVGKLPKAPIDYIITKDIESAPLDLHQFPFRPGAHKEYPMGHYISQPHVRKFGTGANATAMYYGDIHYMTHPVEKDAIRMTKLLNQARLMMNRNDPDLPAFWARNLPDKVEDFVAQFQGKDPLFDKDTPFFHKYSGTNLANGNELPDYYASQRYKFQRASDSEHNLYGNSLDLKFLGERNATLRSFSRTGDIETPAYHWRRAQTIDPSISAYRAFGQLARDQYLSDLKTKLANGFIAEFGHLLDTGGLRAAQENPIPHLIDPKWKRNISGTERAEQAAAKNYRRSAVNFLGLKNDAEKEHWQFMNDVADWANRIFPNSKMEAIEPWLLSKEKNPLNLAKNMAFHVTQGLFNVASLALHASVMLQAQALAGFKVGFRSMGHAFFMGVANASEDAAVHAGIAKLAGSFEKGIKPEHWLESYQAFRRSGFGAVEGEHMLRDTYLSRPNIQNKAGRFVSWGDMFFTNGVKTNRTVAWNIAYNQWRDANPAAKFTDEVAKWVLQKADAYSGSMTVAHRAWWQSGAMSIPTQFLAYPARIVETLWGRDFTPAEKAQWFLRYSAMFGAPSATTVAGPIWPWHKEVNSYLRQHDINVDDNYVYKFLNDGMLGIMFQALAGESLNVSERFGAQGGLSQNVRDVLEGRKTAIELLGGPAGIFEPVGSKTTSSLVWDALKSGNSVFGLSLDAARNLLEGKPVFGDTLISLDFKDVLRSFTGTNHMVNLYHAIMLHKYLSKNNEVLLPQTVRSAWIQYLTGLRPSNLDEMYDVLHDEQVKRDAQASAIKQAEKYFRTMLSTPNVEDQKELYTRMQIAVEAAGLNPHDKINILKNISRGREDKWIQIMQGWATQSKSNFDYVQKKLGKE